MSPFRYFVALLHFLLKTEGGMCKVGPKGVCCIRHHPGDVRGRGRRRDRSFPLAFWYLISRAPRARCTNTCRALLSIANDVFSRLQCESLVANADRSSPRWLRCRRLKVPPSRSMTRPFSIWSQQRLSTLTLRPNLYPNGSGTGSYGTVFRNPLRVSNRAFLVSSKSDLTVHP